MRPSFELDPGFLFDHAAPMAGVLAAMAQTLGMVEGPAPPWLWESQVEAFRRGVAAVRRFGGVLLAMPVGTGKTYVALAIAEAVGDSAPISVVAPAVLVAQWRRVAKTLRMPIDIMSHELASRGRSPPGRGPLIIDESHRFREPTTRRYQTVAPALVGRPTILATATPIVNRAEDLVAQLLLAVRDDALAHRGLASLRSIGCTASVGVPLDELVVGRAGGPAGKRTGGQADGSEVPERQSARIAAGQDPMFDRVLAAIERLGCARDPGVAALIRVALLRALGSSPAALLATLRRYRRLLEHAERAHRAGHPINRRAILEVVGADPEQLVLWELLPTAIESGADLALGDRHRLPPLCRRVARWSAKGDTKVHRLRALLEDRRPTLVFATAVATVHYLRDHLGPSGIGWVTGSGAGIGVARATRSAVLAAFDPSDDGWPSSVPRPWLLLASDVAAEGLNLQRVSRIVHYDLPWTAVRLAQRDGRAIRMGSVHQSVEVVQLDLPEALEQRIAIERAIERKARLPAAVGLDGCRLPGWRTRLVRWSAEAAAPGWVELRAGVAGALAAVVIHSPRGVTGTLLARTADGGWTTEDAAIDDLFDQCDRAVEVPSRRASIESVLASLTEPIERHLASLDFPDLPRPGHRSAIRAMTIRGAELMRARRPRELERVGLVHRFLSRGHSAGESLVARAVAAGDRAAFERAAALGEGASDPAPAIATLVGLVVFSSEPD